MAEKKSWGGKRDGAGRGPDPLKIGATIGVNQFTADGLKIGPMRVMRVTERDQRKAVLEDDKGKIIIIVK